MTLQTVSNIFGWSYTLLFTQCLVLQCIVNYKNKSCLGYSSDFSLVAFAGFSFLLFNQMCGFLDPTSEAGHVGNMDITFAIAATIFSALSYAQTFIYPSEQRNRATSYGVAACVGFWLGCGLFQLLTGRLSSTNNAFSLILMATIFKSSSTCLKYLYQIALNYQRKSCAGLSAPGITLDWIGAICCLTQI